MDVPVKCVITAKLEGTRPLACVYISGVSNTETETVTEATQFLESMPARSDIVIQRSGELVPLFYKPQSNVTEVACESNDNVSTDRHGSVCEIRNEKKDTSAHPLVQPLGKAQKESTKNDTLRQLQELLGRRFDIPECQSEYDDLRQHLARLRAYVRALRALKHSSELTQQNCQCQIDATEAQHPDFKDLYVSHYETVMAQSGYKMDATDPDCVLHYL